MSTYRENLDLLSKKMGPLNPKREYSLLDAVKDASPVKAPKVDTPVIWKSDAAGGQKQSATGGGTAAKTTPSWRAPVYTSKHQKAMDDAVAALKAVKPFEYDPESDPLFQGYKKTYTREGQRAMQDTLGEVSARTGGLASSYATSAAQQANNYYMQQLADKIPQLQEMAYRMYRDRLGDLRADVDLYGGLEDRDRSRFESDRSFDYGVHRDDVGDQQWQKNFDRGVFESDRSYGQSERFHEDSKDQWQKEFDQRVLETDIANGWDVYNATGDVTQLAKALEMAPEAAQKLVDIFNQSQADKQTERDRATADWELSHGVTSKLAEMGYDTSYDQAMLDAERRAAALKGVGSSNSSRKKISDPDPQPTGTSLAREAIIWAAQTGGDPEDYIKANYKKKGYTSKDAAVSELNVYLTENPEWDPSKLSGQMLGKFQAGIDAIKAGGYVPESESSHGAVYNSLMERAEYLTKDDPQWIALADKIDQAYDDGDITEAEYNALTKAMGF